MMKYRVVLTKSEEG